MKFNISHRSINKGLLLLIVMATLQSCFVAKDYVRPELTKETEALYRTENLPTDSVSIANLSWKTMFKDPYLQQYIEDGLKNNMDVRIAIQQMIAAQAYAKQGKAGYLPTLNVGPNYTRQEFSENSQFGSIFTGGLDTYDVTANLSWEADIWGKIRSNKRATQASYLQSVAAHQAVKTQLISSIANTYYNLLALDAQLEITKKTIETRQSGVETIKALKD
ncbi:MAG: TolC family protein, partial [Nonlabens sp.]